MLLTPEGQNQKIGSLREKLCTGLTPVDFPSQYLHYYVADLYVKSLEVIKVHLYGDQVHTIEASPCCDNCEAKPTVLALRMAQQENSHTPALYSKACTKENATVFDDSAALYLYEFSCTCTANICDRLDLFVGKPKVQIKLCNINIV